MRWGKHSSKNKFFSSILISLSIISLITIGYSSWTINKSNKIVSNVETSVGGIENRAPLFSNLQITPFTLTRDGFLKDETIVNEGDIFISFTLDNKLAKEYGYIDQNGNITLEAIFSCDSDTFLSYVENPVMTTKDTVVVPNTLVTKKHINEIQVKVDPTQGTTTVSLHYVIKCDAKEFWKKVPKMNFEVEAITK